MSEFTFNKIIKSDDIETMFEGEISNEVKNHVLSLNLRYRHLSKEEITLHKNIYLDFLDKEIISSGPKRQKDWEKGWGQNLSDVLEKGLSSKTLLPYYYRNGVSVMRYKGKFILPEDENFETKFISIIQLVLSTKYFKNYDNIYELGSGPCHNTFEFALKTKNKNFYTTDWVNSSLEIANIIEKNKNNFGIGTHTFTSNLFNLFEPNEDYKLKSNSILLTCGSMEQLGADTQGLLDYFLMQECNNFIHLEPILELYNRDTEFDNLAFQYSEKRNYLVGFLPKLLELEKKGIIKVHCCNKIIGGPFHDGFNFLRWEKLI
jgi:hypothetical protein